MKRTLFLITIFLASVFGVRSIALAATALNLAWTPDNTGGAADGYEVAYGNAPGTHLNVVDAGKGTIVGSEVTYTIPVWDFSKTQYIVVRAYNTSGRSGDSNELMLGKPFAPTGLRANLPVN